LTDTLVERSIPHYNQQNLAVCVVTLSNIFSYYQRNNISELKVKETNTTDNVHINVTFRSVRPTIVTVEEKSVLHILSVFLALGIQYAKRMRRIFICGPPGSTIFFPHYLICDMIF